MEVQFVDRILNCSDCHGEFIFTAGEQLFFHDKQFKNDPKRCKPCKSRRSGLAAAANGTGPAAAGLSRTETRTECSECGVQTTVPFKPTQGRPVLCRQCFQLKNKAAAVSEPLPVPVPMAVSAETSIPATAAVLTEIATEPGGMTLTADAALLAAASMAAASPQSSVATAEDLASISGQETEPENTSEQPVIPTSLLASVASEVLSAERVAAIVSAPEPQDA